MCTGSEAVPVNKDDGQDGGSHVDSTNNGSVQESRVGTVTHDIKELGGVENDGVDSTELLEERDQDGSSLQSAEHVCQQTAFGACMMYAEHAPCSQALCSACNSVITSKGTLMAEHGNTLHIGHTAYHR